MIDPARIPYNKKPPWWRVRARRRWHQTRRDFIRHYG